MPSRILKDSILTDKAFNSLTLTEESIYHRLLVSADDYGIFYADPILLLRILYPRKTDVTEEVIREGLDHMEEAGIISRYTAEGEDYLKICSWENNQRLRNSRHKFPVPEVEEPTPESAPEPETKEKARQEKPADHNANKKAADKAPKTADEIIIQLPLNDNLVRYFGIRICGFFFGGFFFLGFCFFLFFFFAFCFFHTSEKPGTESKSSSTAGSPMPRSRPEAARRPASRSFPGTPSWKN